MSVSSVKSLSAFRDQEGQVRKASILKCLFENGLISQDEYFANEKLSKYAKAILKAFELGIVQPNDTKQDGILNTTPIRFSFNMSGKLKGVISCSTFCLCNPFCIARMSNPDLVCYYCYATSIPYTWSLVNYVQNTFVLTHRILDDDEIPLLDPKLAELFPEMMVRFESFGDIATYEQAVNYIKTSKRNSEWNFALWTKNPAILARAIDDYGKPDNLVTVLSMSRVNMMDPDWMRWIPYFDYLFVVVKGEKGKLILLKQGVPNPIDCQCGPESCRHCTNCYFHNNSLATVIEKLRNEKVAEKRKPVKPQGH